MIHRYLDCHYPQLSTMLWTMHYISYHWNAINQQDSDKEASHQTAYSVFLLKRDMRKRSCLTDAKVVEMWNENPISKADNVEKKIPSAPFLILKSCRIILPTFLIRCLYWKDDLTVSIIFWFYRFFKKHSNPKRSLLRSPKLIDPRVTRFGDLLDFWATF